MITAKSALVTLRQSVEALELYITEQFNQGRDDDPADGWTVYDETKATLEHDIAQAAEIYLFWLDR